jgi:hypothetical protein
MIILIQINLKIVNTYIIFYLIISIINKKEIFKYMKENNYLL